jgi:hypothetical protein
VLTRRSVLDIVVPRQKTAKRSILTSSRESRARPSITMPVAPEVCAAALIRSPQKPVRSGSPGSATITQPGVMARNIA